jgi:H+-translocating NAD(P) transhydrogenase subunit alpha
MDLERHHMIIAVPTETLVHERRVALVPAAVAQLVELGYEVRVQQGAGRPAGYPDVQYGERGAALVADRAELFAAADIIAQVRTPGANPEAGRRDLELLRSGQIVVGLADPLTAGEPIKLLAERGVTLLALELMPRITRAQEMDVLSSQANLAGYKAVIRAAEILPKIFPMMMTAAGTIKPARMFVLGAGVAGLQAIATGKRLGAVVNAYDVRPAVKEQVESLGARFVELPLETAAAEEATGYAKARSEDQLRRQQELMNRVVAESDVVITTALVPGKPAPKLLSAAMIEAMAPGSVVVDLAAERGGNCELTQPGKTIEHHGVTIVGDEIPVAGVAYHASQMYASNLARYLRHLTRGPGLVLDPADEITAATLVTHQGEVVHAGVREALGLPPREPGGAAGAALPQ